MRGCVHVHKSDHADAVQSKINVFNRGIPKGSICSNSRVTLQDVAVSVGSGPDAAAKVTGPNTVAQHASIEGRVFCKALETGAPDLRPCLIPAPAVATCLPGCECFGELGSNMWAEFEGRASTRRWLTCCRWDAAGAKPGAGCAQTVDRRRHAAGQD
jgi:hypothetical protein